MAASPGAPGELPSPLVFTAPGVPAYELEDGTILERTSGFPRPDPSEREEPVVVSDERDVDECVALYSLALPSVRLTPLSPV